jgi:hypothetical protein
MAGAPAGTPAPAGTLSNAGAAPAAGAGQPAQLSEAQRAVAPAGSPERALMDLIGKSEGTDKRGPDGQRVAGTGYSTTYGNGQFNPGGDRNADLTGKTIAEVRQFQNGMLANQQGQSLRSSAAGRYQMMGYTLDDAMRQGVIKPEDRFDEATQDRLAKWKLDQAGVGRLANGQGDAARVQNALAGTWASLPKADGSAPYPGQHTSVSGAAVQQALASRAPQATPQAPALAANAPAQPPAPALPAPPAEAAAATLPAAPQTAAVTDSSPSSNPYAPPPPANVEAAAGAGAGAPGTPLPQGEQQRASAAAAEGQGGSQTVKVANSLSFEPFRIEVANAQTGEVSTSQHMPQTRVGSASALGGMPA